MMMPDRLQLSLPTSGLESSQSSRAINAFHSWISRRALGEVLIDVADYRHVPHGPGIVLVGLQSNYMLQDSRGTMRLSCFRKGGDAGSPLLDTLRRTLRASALLQAALEIPGFQFDASRLEVSVFDRRATDLEPFDIEAFASAAGAELSAVYETAPLLDVHEVAPRPTITATWTKAPHVSTLLRHIEQASAHPGAGA